VPCGSLGAEETDPCVAERPKSFFTTHVRDVGARTAVGEERKSWWGTGGARFKNKKRAQTP